MTNKHPSPYYTLLSGSTHEIQVHPPEGIPRKASHQFTSFHFALRPGGRSLETYWRINSGHEMCELWDSILGIFIFAVLPTAGTLDGVLYIGQWFISLTFSASLGPRSGELPSGQHSIMEHHQDSFPLVCFVWPWRSELQQVLPGETSHSWIFHLSQRFIPNLWHHHPA